MGQFRPVVTLRMSSNDIGVADDLVGAKTMTSESLFPL